MLTPELTKSIISYVQDRIIAQAPASIQKFGMSMFMNLIRERPAAAMDFIKTKEPAISYIFDAMNMAKKEDGSLDTDLLQKVARETIHSTGPISVFGYNIGSAEVDDILTYFAGRNRNVSL